MFKHLLAPPQYQSGNFTSSRGSQSRVILYSREFLEKSGDLWLGICLVKSAMLYSILHHIGEPWQHMTPDTNASVKKTVTYIPLLIHVDVFLYW